MPMKVGILGKIYHPSNNPNISTPVHRQKDIPS